MKETFGAGSTELLKEIINHLAARRVFIVSGKKSYELSGAEGKLSSLLKGVDAFRYCKFEENPTFKDLLKGAGIVRDYNPELIIAIGGGSVMDTAKVISVLPADKALAEMMVKGETGVPDKIAPLVAIPTTSGSGSEATHFAVCYLDKKKYSVAGETLLPDYVILDPELTYSMPPYQTAVSGMDALCQGIESYWAKGATHESRTYAIEAIALILKNIEKAVKRPDLKSRLAMAKGSNLAGKAINISKTTAPHALSYGFTMYHNIPHGHAVSLTMGDFIFFNSELAYESSDEKLKSRMVKLFNLFGCENAICTRSRFQQIMRNIGLQTKLSDMVSIDVDIHQLAEAVNFQRLNNHPIAVSNDSILKILMKVI